MQIHISARHLKLTAAIQAYVAQKLSHLDHFRDDIIGIHVVLWEEQKTSKPQFHIKVHVAVPGPDIHLHEKGPDLYAAIDETETKLERQFRKKKTRETKQPRQKAQKSVEKEKKFGRS